MTEPTTSDADTKAPETPIEAASAPESAEQAPEASPGHPDPDEAAQQAPPPAAEATLPPEQPSDAVAEELGGKAVVIATPAGALTLDPNQKELSTEQKQALVAIGIDTVRDPQVIPQVRPFMHMCQIRGLDPWAREAYLIGRGRDNNRKFTMQTGIDGYRKMGAATGRFIRVKKRMWTGSEADPNSWVQVTDDDGDIVRKRVWFEQWPAAYGNPAAAKVVIEHYDDHGNVTTTAAVADWEMYAPYNDVWEGPSGNRRKKVDADGKPVRELNDMWTKGGPHMLAKCAEALAYRMAFPARMSGIYVTEEMHRLDQQERTRVAAEQAQARREALAQSRRQQRPPTSAPPEDIVEAEVVEHSTAETVSEVVAEIKGDAEDAARLLLAELHWQAEVLGQKPEAIARRRIAALKKNLDQFTAAELHPIVNGMRGMAVEAAKRNDLPEAAAYAAVAVDGAGPIDVDALSPEDEVHEAEIVPDEQGSADPDDEHVFVATDTGDCFRCGLALDVGPHVEAEGEEEE